MCVFMYSPHLFVVKLRYMLHMFIILRCVACTRSLTHVATNVLDVLEQSLENVCFLSIFIFCDVRGLFLCFVFVRLIGVCPFLSVSVSCRP